MSHRSLLPFIRSAFRFLPDLHDERVERSTDVSMPTFSLSAGVIFRRNAKPTDHTATADMTSPSASRRMLSRINRRKYPLRRLRASNEISRERINLGSSSFTQSSRTTGLKIHRIINDLGLHRVSDSLSRFCMSNKLLIKLTSCFRSATKCN